VPGLRESNRNPPYCGAVVIQEGEMSRTIAILGGGDWADASVDHVKVPDAMSLDEMHSKYLEWLRVGPKWKSFTDWLLKNGASMADVEYYQEV